MEKAAGHLAESTHGRTFKYAALSPHRTINMMRNIVYNMDCMDFLKTQADKAFDLAIVDPPYGGGAGAGIGGRFERYETQFIKPEAKPLKVKHWDIAPPKEYFDELFRVSKNQIIWGGNYFPLPGTRCFLVWRKLTISENFSMAMAEYAWTSFNQNAKVFECAPQGTASEKRIHPTQKPVALYSWILRNYAKPGDKILDTHVGSGSSRIACRELGFDFTGCELDRDYWEAQERRFREHCAQGSLFEFEGGKIKEPD